MAATCAALADRVMLLGLADGLAFYQASDCAPLSEYTHEGGGITAAYPNADATMCVASKLAPRLLDTCHAVGSCHFCTAAGARNHRPSSSHAAAGCSSRTLLAASSCTMRCRKT